MIIGLTGEKLSGKGTAAAYFKKKYQAEYFTLSNILSDILKRLHLENTRKNLVTLGITIRQAFGNDILAQTLKQDVLESQSSMIIIDGLRYPIEHEIFKNLPEYHLVYITAPIETRFSRLQQRTEKLDEQHMTLDEFIQREQDQTETGIQELKHLAMHTIQNTSSFENLYTQLDNAVA